MPVEVIKEVEKIVTKEVPVEVIKEVEKIVEKKVEVVNEKELNKWKAKYGDLDGKMLSANKRIKTLADAGKTYESQISKLNKELSKKPKEVEVIKEVPVKVEVEKIVTKEVVNDKELNKWKAKYKDLDSKSASLKKDNTRLERELAKKPKEVEVIREIEVIKEVPIEIVKEVEVVKQIDFDSLKSMMMNMNTEVVSKQVVGETRTAKTGKVVGRREVKAGGKKKATKKATSKTTTKVKSKTATKAKAKTATKKKATGAKAKKDDLKKIEGIGPKIEQLLHNDGIKTFKQLANAKVTRLRKILHDAGSRYKMHDPGSWPRQSNLAAKGEWKKLDALQDKLQGGR